MRSRQAPWPGRGGCWLAARGTSASPRAPLKGAKRQILQLLANVLSQGRIAKELFTSSKTVGTHIQRTLGKLGVHSRTEAVAAAFRQGLVRTSSESET
jgi:DNA-binding NarL/FixJ family response regulator